MPRALVSAFGLVFWSQSVIAEVYTLHAMVFAALLRVMLELRATGAMPELSLQSHRFDHAAMSGVWRGG